LRVSPADRCLLCACGSCLILYRQIVVLARVCEWPNEGGVIEVMSHLQPVIAAIPLLLLWMAMQLLLLTLGGSEGEVKQRRSGWVLSLWYLEATRRTRTR